MEEWEVYGGPLDGALHVALDEILFRKPKAKNILLLPEYERPVLVLARDQHPNDVISAIPYTRSWTSGGAMLCGSNILGFSIIVPRDAECKDYRRDPVATHKHFGGIIQHVLEKFGVQNTILGEQYYIKVQGNGQKLPLAGTSQRFSNNAQIYHGIITIDPWDADHLNRTIRLRNNNGKSEYELLKQLPSVRAYCKKPLDQLKSELKAALAEKIAGTTTINPLPSSLMEEARDLVSLVYFDKEWTSQARHNYWKNISPVEIREGRGFCLLGSEFK